MKRSLLKKSIVSLALIALAAAGSAQTLKDFFSSSETPCLYLGVDFTKNKFIDYSTANVTDIRDHQYNMINEVIINEPKKYEVNKAFHKSQIDHDLSYVNEKNTKANTEEMLSSNSSDYHRFKESDVAEVVKTYNFKGKKGLGIMIVVEACSKGQKGVAGWVTIIDMGSGKMLFTDRVEGRVGMGFTFRNVWAAGIKNILDEVEKTEIQSMEVKGGRLVDSFNAPGYLPLTDSTEILVRFNEADPLGIVWHGHYIRYFEDGREAFGNRYGLGYLEVYEKGFSIPVVHVDCSYKRSLRYGDTVLVETLFTPCEAAKLLFSYRLFNKKTKELVATGTSTQVFLDRTHSQLQLTNPDFFEAWKKKYLTT